MLTRDQTIAVQQPVGETPQAPPVTRDPAEMTLRQILAYTYENSPSLLAARAGLKATQQDIAIAASNWKPQINAEASLNITDIEGSNFGGAAAGPDPADGSTAKDYILSLDQPLYRGGRTVSAISAARAAINAAQADFVARVQDVLIQAAAAGLNLQRDRALLELNISNRDVIARQLEATELRYEVGELTLTDSSQARSRLAEAEALLQRAEGNLRAGEAVFEQITGLSAFQYRGSSFTPVMPESLDAALSVAESGSPAVVYAESAYHAAEEDVDTVFGELLPALSLRGSWNRTYDPVPGLIPEQTSASIIMAATMPLYDGDSVRSRVRKAKYTANQRYLEIAEAKRAARQTLVAHWQEWQSAAAELEARIKQVTAAQTARDGVFAEEESGARTVLDVLDAEQELFNARVLEITSRRDELAARFSILGSLGWLTPARLGFDGPSLDLSGDVDSIAWTFLDTSVDRVGE